MRTLPPTEARHAPATLRNREPILDVLRDVLPPAGEVLEIASGTGEHAAFFAENLPHLRWQPSDPDPEQRRSIAAWRREAIQRGVHNLLEPIALDAGDSQWPLVQGAVAAIVCINMIHIAPWDACVGLLRGCGAYLPPGGVLFLYGPYKVDGRHTAQSNQAFDVSLRGIDPAFGVRDRDEVIGVANSYDLSLTKDVLMPANNRSLVLRKAPGNPSPIPPG